MARRRANNEGTIYQRSDGKWRAQITLGNRRMSKTLKTQKECQEWLRKTVLQINQGFNFKGSNIKLKDFLVDSSWFYHRHNPAYSDLNDSRRFREQYKYT